jgi:hypothetical protein
MHFTNNTLLSGTILEKSFCERLNERIFSSTAWKFSWIFSSPSAAQSASRGARLHAAAVSIAGAARRLFCSWQFYFSRIVTGQKQIYYSNPISTHKIYEVKTGENYYLPPISIFKSIPCLGSTEIFGAWSISIKIWFRASESILSGGDFVVILTPEIVTSHLVFPPICKPAILKIDWSFPASLFDSSSRDSRSISAEIGFKRAGLSLSIIRKAAGFEITRSLGIFDSAVWASFEASCASLAACLAAAKSFFASLYLDSTCCTWFDKPLISVCAVAKSFEDCCCCLSETMDSIPRYMVPIIVKIGIIQRASSFIIFWRFLSTSPDLISSQVSPWSNHAGISAINEATRKM